MYSILGNTICGASLQPRFCSCRAYADKVICRHGIGDFDTDCPGWSLPFSDSFAQARPA
ncbi:MAG: SWIM zinc finger family protein [Anaerolineales bacterium]|nr:SWIM zinc finger family protein [Chloroflexota bacterium]MCC6986070.1 SWIM zinc finger family protein [Anaerolineales bacterium]